MGCVHVGCNVLLLKVGLGLFLFGLRNGEWAEVLGCHKLIPEALFVFGARNPILT